MLNISTGKLPRAQRVVIYGVEGIGKTTLASGAPDPLYIDTEGGTAHLDVKRLQRPRDWTELISMVREVANTPDCCRTLVIDTADWAEQLLVQHVLNKYSKKGIEDFGYGKGYVYLAEEFGALLTACDSVITSGRNVIIIAHAIMRKQELPDEAGAFDRWELKLSKKIAPMLKEWADALLFANYKTLVIQGENGKARAQGARRVIYTTHQACWDAKNRHGLKDELPMEYSAIAGLFPLNAQPEAPRSAVIPGIAQQIQQEARAAAKKPAAKKKEAPASGPMPDPTMPPVTAETLAELRGWMDQACIKDEHIQKLVAQKGHFDSRVPIEQYPERFVRTWLMRNWAQVVTTIQADPEYIPF